MQSLFHFAVHTALAHWLHLPTCGELVRSLPEGVLRRIACLGSWWSRSSRTIQYGLDVTWSSGKYIWKLYELFPWRFEEEPLEVSICECQTASAFDCQTIAPSTLDGAKDRTLLYRTPRRLSIHYTFSVRQGGKNWSVFDRQLFDCRLLFCEFIGALCSKF